MPVLTRADGCGWLITGRSYVRTVYIAFHLEAAPDRGCPLTVHFPMKRMKGSILMKNTKTKSIVALAIVLVLTVVFGIVGVTGMSFQGGLWKLLPWLPTTNADAWPQAISLGLDLRGGVYVEYSAEAPEGNDANFSDLLDATVSAIQSRLTDKGYAESTVQVLGTSGHPR